MSALTSSDIAEIEAELGLPLPADVHEQYLRSNGLLGPTKCQLLYTYKESKENDIVHANTLRAEEWFPEAFKSTVLLGNDGCGNNICYNWDTKEAMLWNPADGDYIQERRSTVKEMWAFVEMFYANQP